MFSWVLVLRQLVDKESGKPWRGQREKDARFLQFFIEGCSDKEDVVLDCIAATGLFMLWEYK